MKEATDQAQQMEGGGETAENPKAPDQMIPASQAGPSAEELQGALSDVRGVLEQRDGEVQALRRQLASATARYRVALLNAAPEVPEELVTGATPEELEASLARGRQMVERIRSRIEAQMAEQRVPTGAPIRSGVDVAGMSPGEKIAYALAQRERG